MIKYRVWFDQICKSGDDIHLEPSLISRGLLLGNKFSGDFKTRPVYNFQRLLGPLAH